MRGANVGTRAGGWRGPAACAILAAGTAAIYSRTFSVPLLLDDITPITDNPSIRRLWPLWQVFSPPADCGTGGRPLINLSYALNYAAGGTAVAGYHAVNLAIHVLAALVLFGLVRRTLELPSMARRFGAASIPLALAVAAIWAWHPLQTESVTYISQRAESLMALFYLLTLYFFVRSVDCGSGFDFRVSGFKFQVSAVIVCALGSLSKEVIVTAPIAVFLYDRTFVSGSFSASWRRHRALYLGLAATWIPLGLLLHGLQHRGVGFDKGVSGLAYALAECRVVVAYIRLSVFPSPLVFDYGPWTPAEFPSSWSQALIVAAALGASALALRRYPAAGFAACWFFLILAPTSTVVPIVGQPMAESRLYLPLAGVAALAVLGSFALAGRRMLYVFAGIAVLLGGAAAARNRDYLSAEAIWADTVAKCPGNPRAHNNLGNVWLKEPGRLPAAIGQYRIAIGLDPGSATTHDNLGNAYRDLPGAWDAAVGEYQEAVRLAPDDPEARNNLGAALLKEPGRLAGAIDQLRAAVRLKPWYAEAHDNLGTALLGLPGGADDAIAEYREALRLDPRDPEAHFNLANVWAAAPGGTADAAAAYRAALGLRPGFAEAHFNLGNVLMKGGGRMGEAAAEFEAALRARPGYAEAEFNLAVALLNLGKYREAEGQLEAFLKLRPGNQAALRILEQLRASGR